MRSQFGGDALPGLTSRERWFAKERHHRGMTSGGGGGWCSGRAIFGMAVDPSGCVDARRGIDIGGVGAPDARYLAWRWTRQDTRGFLLVRGGARSYGRVPGSPRPVGGGSAVARLRGNGGVTPVRSRVGASGQRGSDELDIRGAFIFEGLSRLYARS